MDWSSFVPTLLATLAGAAVGVAGVYLAFRWESTAKYEAKLDDAFADVIREFARRNEDLHSWMNQGGAGEVLSPPPDLALVSAIEVVEMLARGNDVPFAKDLAFTYYAIKNADPRRQPGANGIVAGTVGRWRSGAWSLEKARESLDAAKNLARRPVANQGDGTS